MSTKIFAHIPGPIIFGHVVDLNCVIWQKVCDKTGFCWVYNLGAQTKVIVTVIGMLSGKKSIEDIILVLTAMELKLDYK